MALALAAYRQILRSARIAFQGDPRVLTAARIEVKSKFKAHQFLPADDPGTEQKIAEAREVARILRQNIVQGKQVSAEAGKEQRYQLRIHSETERGDNESTKMGNTLASDACCGGS